MCGSEGLAGHYLALLHPAPCLPNETTSQRCKAHLPPSLQSPKQNHLQDNFLSTQGRYPNYTPSLPCSHTSPLPTPTFPHVLVTGQWRGQSTIPCGETTQHFPLNDCGAGVCTVLHCKISVIWSIAFHNFIVHYQSNPCLPAKLYS